MLSIKDPPPDPPCSTQFPYLETATHERTSHGFQLPEIGLHNPAPINHHVPLHNFSLRNYVFAARNKDIKTNWPFSVKTLQLCVKHDMKDVLPPFQSIGYLRNQQLKRCTVETITSYHKENITNFDLGGSSCRTVGENSFPSTLSELESDSINRTSSSSFQTDTILKLSDEVKAACLSVKSTGESKLKKRCKLIVKLGASSEPSCFEDISSSITTVSETMASKLCPVCKTFSSSSNTTLNAHIDQCLYKESKPKWSVYSNLLRHKIKPRRTRVMEDIYATAPRCTLESLDRRNGTSWAPSGPALQAWETKSLEAKTDGKEQRLSQGHPDDVGDGPVYIDANKTKLRSLSKLSDMPSMSKLDEDLEGKKSLKGGKQIPLKKKKFYAPKKVKYLNLVPQGHSNIYVSDKAYGYEIFGSRKPHHGVGRSYGEEHKMMKQILTNDCGTLRQWVCSRRRGRKDGNHSLEWKRNVAQNLLANNRYSSIVEPLKERNYGQTHEKLFEDPASSPI